jgi:Domain of unknown function (DUF4365)
MAQTPVESQSLYAGVAPVENASKARLGYDYLRILCAQASFDCARTLQHPDGCGVDVRIEVREKLDPDARLTDFSLDFQVRATSRRVSVVDNKIVVPLEVDRYELLRSVVPDRPSFIVLISLPTDFDDSDALAAEDLVTHRLGRWLCLSGAPQTSNTTSTPVRFPTWNVLTSAALREIARRVSIGWRFFHEQ